ncbi:cell division protein CrgA [Propionicicella superfundia]|uniref:cell division protein CrgA n=1 Tax=Propionicicella superfundia TaxID=348582 RepID=UPI00041E0FDD|nr:cell division protein CrgA [Propionicicella superfundia]
MPESKTRKAADQKKKTADKQERARKEADRRRRARVPGSRRWVPPTFITLGLLGVLWLILYYIASPYIPFLADLGGWNILIGLGLMGGAFAVATLWK